MDKLDEYRAVPRDLAVGIPQGIRANEAEIFGMYLSMATEGISMSKACESTSFAIRSILNWANNYPMWMSKIQASALAEAIRYKVALVRRLSAARIDIELQAERLILDQMLDIVRSTIREAVAGNLPAVRLVRTWAREGLGLLSEDQLSAGAEYEQEIEQLSYDPTQPLTRADVRSPPGTTVTVTVETPEPPIEAIVTEVPRD